MQVITSKDNEVVKSIKKLKEKKYRDDMNQFVVEGIKLVNEAIEENVNIDSVVVCEDCVNDGTIDKKMLYEIAKYKCIYVTERIFETLTDVSNPQGILAVVNRESDNSEIDFNQDFIVALDGIQDPGNLGTILRTVDSAGLNQIILSKETADSFNPKVVRSTMGGIFRVKPVKSENLVKTLKDLQNHGFEIVVTSLDTDNSVYDINYNKKVVVIGNEANGVSKEVQKLADKRVKIPMLGKTESLNASVAAGIMIYEYVRSKVK
ncbi:MAG: 23S rRNA (guanosine(2251)-2'-O)-methyltransferase RlmB [Clostridia bacterium]|nr:23S rRNA (guanosine(2251)-2'-O)-methyltransferase RlmB [Clostridia bacterium]